MTTGPARICAIGILCLLGTAIAAAQDHSETYVSPIKGAGNFFGHTDRPLRYRPDGADFVIDNGAEFFNRPLYGQPTPFRVDGGDQPEFSLYAPGQAGNLRLGMRTAAGAKWLFAAERRETRYRAGSLVYAIHDALLGEGATLVVTAIPTTTVEGLIVRAELQGAPAKPVDLVWAFGGASGLRGRRNGDIGTEEVPIGQFFQLTPQGCTGNTFSVTANGFRLESKIATLQGVTPAGAKLAIGDCQNWQTLDKLLAGLTPLTRRPAQQATPLLIGNVNLRAGAPTYLAIYREPPEPRSPNAQAGPPPAADESRIANAATAQSTQPSAGTRDPTQTITRRPARANLPQIFAEAERYRSSVAGRVVAQTPDPFINAALPALLAAADGIWDEAQSAYMHGAVAWRTKLLGWRGPYSGDALGQHDRARRHFSEWAQRQNTDPVPSPLPAQDPTVNFARNEPALHTNGDLSNSHYDMNLVYIDALFRHILWTGDLDFARRMWPMIERHLEWERRSFRRTFGEQSLPLYEGYAAIWASDDLEYHGGGAAHASAYNYYHNLMAARIARQIGKNVAVYEKEAAQILAGMRDQLWMSDRGWYGEWRDALGLKLLHPNAGLWSIYHTIDSEVPDSRDAWQMTRFVDTQIAHIPIRGPNVPDGTYTLPTTSWMPYSWSINNVVMAESLHTALSFWQANRADEAYRLFKGALLDSMFLGLCPGNVGMTTAFDMARREAQRDFGDSIGVLSRAFIEGLFGVRPNALDGELLIKPGFPADWNRAVLRHPDFSLQFERVSQEATLVDHYAVDSNWKKPMALRMQLAAPLSRVASVKVNGAAADWRNLEEAVETPRIEIRSDPAAHYEIEIEWRGDKPAKATVPTPIVAQGATLDARLESASVVKWVDTQNALSDVHTTRDGISGSATGPLGHRALFAQVRQGDLSWWAPVVFEIRPPFEAVPQDEGFTIRNNTAQNAEVLWQIDSGPGAPERIRALGKSITLPSQTNGLLPGTHRISLALGSQLVDIGAFSIWQAAEPSARWRTIKLTSHFNDRVTQIFRNEYLKPRPQSVSLSIPKQGYGSWAHWDAQFAVDDTGLRAAAERGGGKIQVAGVPFEIPVTANEPNILFTSRWDNYPPEATIPLAGKSPHIYLLMAGSTNWMQSRFDNGEIVITYSDGQTTRLALNNPVNWWPIDQDYFIDDFAFRRPDPIPPRVDLKTGEVRILAMTDLRGRGRTIPGGAATVLDLPLDQSRALRSLTLRTLSNEVVIGLMAVTLAEPK
jgi:Domain of unknown function (DUF4450)